MTDPTAPTTEEAIARVERMVRTREPIEWIKGPGDLPLRRTQGGKEAAALRVLVDLARDGQRWRAHQPKLDVLMEWYSERLCCPDCDAIDDMSHAEDCRFSIFDPAEPVTPSAEESDE